MIVLPACSTQLSALNHLLYTSYSTVVCCQLEACALIGTYIAANVLMKVLNECHARRDCAWNVTPETICRGWTVPENRHV